MHEVLPKLNVNFFTGMPVKMKHGPHCYLIEYREGHPCPLVLGCGQGVKMYLRMDQIEADYKSFYSMKTALMLIPTQKICPLSTRCLTAEDKS